MIVQSPPALSLPLRTPRVVARPAVTVPEEVRPRFTADGSRELEEHLHRTCERIAAGVRGLIPARKLELILLGGGYGRGEGGVLRTPAGDRPYNDLEFYVCIRGNRHLNEKRFGRALHVLGEILTPQAGVEVEFKITSLHELEQSGVSMFSYDLLMGHRCLAGHAALLQNCSHHRDAERIPFDEATRLLMNRCTGLLLAQERLLKAEFTGADADFVRRNIAKAELAMGDAMLVPFGQYHWSVRERERRVERLARIESIPWLHDVCRHHGVGVDFKLHPQRSNASREELREMHAAVVALAEKVWLWTEDWRLRAKFGAPRGYALCSRNKLPHTRPTRNALLTLKSFGWRALLEPRGRCHPRERVFHALALLLWDREALTRSDTRARLQSELRTDATDFAGMMRAYRELWSRVN
jgi:hypothetical protein